MTEQFQENSFHMKDEVVYHFTCAGTLPWIIATKELRPGRNAIGAFPDPDFLWATTNPNGDRTASAMEVYRRGRWPLVRLTLPAEDFEPWPDITERFPDWTPELVQRLERAAQDMGQADTKGWRARTEPQPLTRVIRTEAKLYTGKWRPIELVSVHHPGDLNIRGVSFNGLIYGSSQHIRPGKPTSYSLFEWSGADRGLVAEGAA